MYGAGGLALYSGEFERHWLEVVHKDISISGLPAGFEGVKVAQLSDIHLDEFTEPFLLREAIDQINRTHPDYVLLTGDYVTSQVLPRHLTAEAARQCGRLLNRLECPKRYAIFGNHDIWAGERKWARLCERMILRCCATNTCRWTATEAGCGWQGWMIRYADGLIRIERYPLRFRRFPANRSS